ncbi:DUF2964 family protein [Burkholderia ubonensis]|uniref:DUF2964 domain-containing protein n=1 Tax=Burkholderia ubonensis TaxID=101571 RepID=A0AAW3N607_9BURK|nr:DUF2964 family protein [Burkholderia ubonensis]KVT41278.1 hypothetical protein WK53_19635 [Burkholderia ubonensis]
MIRKQSRIVLATFFVFVTLGALLGIVHGMLFDNDRVFEYAIVALISGIVAFVALLNPTARDDQ